MSPKVKNNFKNMSTALKAQNTKLKSKKYKQKKNWLQMALVF